MEASTESSISSVTEYISAMKEESELESTVNSVNVEWEEHTKDTTSIFKKQYAIDALGATEKHQESAKKFRKMYIAALAALLNAVSMGFGSTYSSTATEDMKREDSIVRPTQDEIGWIGSLLALGALLGGMAAGHLSQSVGRKGALIFSTIPYIQGWLLIAYASSVVYVYIGRTLIGFCCGLVSVTTPMYLVEISTPDVRGLLGASFQLFVTIGILVVSCLGSFLHWNWLAVAGAALSVLTLLLMIFVPESPRWLMAKGRKEEALWTINFLQGNFLDAHTECNTIQEDIDNQPKGRFQFRELNSPEVYKPLLLSFSLMFFQQFSGVNAVLFYTVSIFNKPGSPLTPTSAAIIVAAVQVAATLVSSILVDKAGRKLLLLVSGSIMAVSLGVFGGFDFTALQNKSNENFIRSTYGWLPLLCVIVFISAFSLGYGPIPWLMVSEMTSARHRSATSGAATAFNWTCVFIVTKSFYYMSVSIHDYGTYWTFAAICVISCFFAYFLLPETKGKEMEEIQLHFISKKDNSTIMNPVVV